MFNLRLHAIQIDLLLKVHSRYEPIKVMKFVKYKLDLLVLCTKSIPCYSDVQAAPAKRADNQEDKNPIVSLRVWEISQTLWSDDDVSDTSTTYYVRSRSTIRMAAQN